MRKSWIRAGFDRGLILDLLKSLYGSDSTAPFNAILMLLAVADIGQTRGELTINLGVLAKSGYVELVPDSGGPGVLNVFQEPPETIAGVRILPKGISWTAGELPTDPEVLR